MKWYPKKLDAEYELLVKEAFARMPDDDTYRSEDFSAIFKWLIEEKGNPIIAQMVDLLSEDVDETIEYLHEECSGYELVLMA